MAKNNRLFNCTLTLSKIKEGVIRAENYAEATNIILAQWLPVVDEEGFVEIVTQVHPYVENLEETSYQFLAQEAAEMFADMQYKIQKLPERGSAIEQLMLIGESLCRFIQEPRPVEASVLFEFVNAAETLQQTYEGAEDGEE